MPSAARFLDDLAARAGRSLSAVEVERLVGEARRHLEDSIQARLELGASPEVAEAQTVEAFGPLKEIVRAAESLHRARFQPLFLGCATAGGLSWEFAILASPLLPRAVVVIAGGVFFTLLAIFVRASEVRRPWRPVLGAAFAFWMAFTLLCAAWIRDFSFEGWLTPRFEGPVDLAHAALWSGVATVVFVAYVALAYRMARPTLIVRGHRG